MSPVAVKTAEYLLRHTHLPAQEMVDLAQQQLLAEVGDNDVANHAIMIVKRHDLNMDNPDAP